MRSGGLTQSPVTTFTGVVDGPARRTAQAVVTGAATPLTIAVGLPLWRRVPETPC